MLYNEGYMHTHPDVWIANLLFPVDSRQGVKLINYDLTEVEGELYPDRYNKNK